PNATYSISSRLRKEKEEAQQKKFLENLKKLHINLPFIEALAQMPKFDDLDDTINAKAQELLVNDEPDSFLSRGLEKSIDQLDLEDYKPVECNNNNDSRSDEPIRRIASINTPYSVVQERAKPIKAERLHLYSACPNETDEKKPELKDLPNHLEYAYLHGFFQIPIAPEDQEKTTFTCPYGTFAYQRMPFGLCNALATFQRCMTTIFHDMVEDFMEVFMDNFSVTIRILGHCMTLYISMLARCEETNLVLNWEQCHFMVKEGIVLGHKISGAGEPNEAHKVGSASVKGLDIEIKDKRG
ncbi:RNA-directed DNA polymerase, partial [Tanacetum coccineum]